MVTTRARTGTVAPKKYDVEEGEEFLEGEELDEEERECV
jgi:hypothetical protein